MIISSRTPEGSPGRCPLCEAFVRIEPSCLTGDAPCPRCGHLLWFFAVPPAPRFYEHAPVPAGKRRAIEAVLARVYGDRGVRVGQGTTSFGEEVGADSLDVVEAVMELEEELGCTIPDAAAEKFRSLGDAIDYLLRQGPEGE